MNKVDNKRDLERELRQNKRVLALFCASWCPFCRSFFAAFDRKISNYSFDLVLQVYIDDYDNPLWEEYSIEAVPTIILFEQGEVARRLDAELGSGLNETEFSEWLRQL